MVMGNDDDEDDVNGDRETKRSEKYRV
jgi:hypothetical protein